MYALQRFLEESCKTSFAAHRLLGLTNHAAIFIKAHIAKTIKNPTKILPVTKQAKSKRIRVMINTR